MASPLRRQEIAAPIARSGRHTQAPLRLHRPTGVRSIVPPVIPVRIVWVAPQIGPSAVPGNSAGDVGVHPSGNRRTGLVQPPGNATTHGAMSVLQLDDGPVVTLGGRRP